MTADERRRQLSDYLAQRGYADLSLLVKELGVSESTIRRDLSQLEDEGIVRRTHGGGGVCQRPGACAQLCGAGAIGGG